MKCLNCSTGVMKPPKDDHSSYIVCDTCSAFELVYEPMDYQESVHTVPIQLNEDGSPQPQIIFVAGGLTKCQARLKHDKIGETLTA